MRAFILTALLVVDYFVLFNPDPENSETPAAAGATIATSNHRFVSCLELCE